MAVKGKDSMHEVEKVAFPIFICNWILSIGILEYPFGKPRRLLSSLYLAINLIIYCLLSIYTYPQTIAFSRQIEANDGIANVFFGCHIFLTMSTILLGWLRSGKMHSILKRGIAADEFLEEIEINKDYRKVLKLLLRKQLVHVLMIVTAVSLINFSYIYKKQLPNGNIIAVISFNYPLVVMSVVDATFINLVEYSNLKFKILNNTLKNTLTTSSDIPQYLNTIKYCKNEGNTLEKPSKAIVISDKNYTVSVARKVHLHLIIFCEKINEAFAAHILISVLVAIFMLTMSFYHSYNVYTSTTDRAASFQKIFPLMSTLIIYNSLKIYLFTKCCSDVIQETVSTGDILSEMYNEIITEESKNEIRNFEIQLIQHPLKFHLCNLIPLDCSLTQKVIGTVTTYLVILTQCGKVTLRVSE